MHLSLVLSHAVLHVQSGQPTRRAVLAAGCSLTVPQPVRAILDTRCAEEFPINGGYLSRCFDDARRDFDWPAVGRISIDQGVAGFGQTGQVVWNAGALLAEHMALRLGPNFFAGKRVLELGCGTGLPGIVAARLGASRLVLTDGTAEVLARAKQNAASNLKDVPWAAQQLNFGEVTPEDLAGKFDVLIASGGLTDGRDAVRATRVDIGGRSARVALLVALTPNEGRGEEDDRYGEYSVGSDSHHDPPEPDGLRSGGAIAECCWAA